MYQEVLEVQVGEDSKVLGVLARKSAARQIAAPDHATLTPPKQAYVCQAKSDPLDDRKVTHLGLSETEVMIEK